VIPVDNVQKKYLYLIPAMRTRKCYGRVVIDPRPSFTQLALLHVAAFLTGAILSVLLVHLFL
jgi:hypothetical protein